MMHDPDEIRRVFARLSREAKTPVDLLTLAREVSFALMDLRETGDRVSASLVNGGEARADAETLTLAFEMAEQVIDPRAERVSRARRERAP